MYFALNLLWFILGGFLAALLWLALGVLLYITIIGIPFGVAAFRIAGFAAFPFGRELIDARLVGGKRIAGTGLANVLWVVLAGFWLAAAHVILGTIAFLTIVGIPFGMAHYRLAKVSFAPLGKRAVPSVMAKRAMERTADAELDARLSTSHDPLKKALEEGTHQLPTHPPDRPEGARTDGDARRDQQHDLDP